MNLKSISKSIVSNFVEILSVSGVTGRIYVFLSVKELIYLDIGISFIKNVIMYIQN